jgi:hypothetical protein
MGRQVYEAIVSDAADPDHRGRIKVKCRALLDGGTDLPDWLEPCFPFAGQGVGFFFLPQPGDVVEIEVLTGDSYDDLGGEAMLLDLGARWRCGLYRDADDVPEEFREAYGKRMGIKGRGGQILLLDDDAGSVLLGATKVLLGAKDASHAVPHGDTLQSALSTILGALAAHVHPTALGASGPPDNAATYTGQKANPVDNGGLLSTVTFTK